MEENGKERLRSIKYLLKCKKENQALSEIVKYVEDYPDDVYGKFQYGVILKKFQEYDKAIDIFYDLYENDAPNKYSALYEMGRMKALIGEYDYAKFYFEKILDESPYPEIFPAIELAKLEKREGNLNKAESLLENVVNNMTDYNLKYAVLELAKIKLIRKKRDEALKLINKLKKDRNEKFNRKIMQFRGKIAVSDNEYEEALTYFDLSLGDRKDDVYWSSILEEAKIYFKMGNLEESYNLCCRLKNMKNLFLGDVDLLLGNIYLEQGKIDEAEKCYLGSLKSKKTFVEKEFLFNLGNIQIIRRDFDKAREYFNEVTEYNQLYKAPAYFQLLYLNIRENKYEEAYDIIDKLKQLEINGDMVKSINKARLYLDVKTNKNINLNKSYSYSDLQIIKYSEENALEHIADEDKRDVKFMEEIDVFSLFHTIGDKLTDDKLTINSIMDSYTIDYPNIGTYNGEVIDELKVICLPNTKQIITMYPNHKNKKQTFDLEGEKEEEYTSKKKVKRLSQVDKFNARYGIKN